MKKAVLFFMASVAALPFFTACEGAGESASGFRHIEIVDPDHGLMNSQTFIEGADGHTGRRFSRADSINPFGMGYSYLIPDSMIGKAITVSVDAWVRSGDLSHGCELVVSCVTKDSLTLWQVCGVRDFLKNPNEWTNVTKSIDIPANISKSSTYINVLTHNAEPRSYIDIDDLKIEYTDLKPVN